MEEGTLGLGDTAVPANRNRNKGSLFCSGYLAGLAGKEGGADRAAGALTGTQSLCKQSRQLVQSCCTAWGREAQRGMYVYIRLSHAAVWQKLALTLENSHPQLKKNQQIKKRRFQ